MSYCSKCGKEVPTDATYCPHCGSLIRVPAPTPPIAPAKKKATKLQRVVVSTVGVILGIIIISTILPALWHAPPTQLATNYLNQGNNLYKAGKYEQAVAEYTKAIELDPSLTSAYYNRGLAYLQMKEYDSALADFNKAIKINPKDSMSWNGKGMTLEKLGKYKEALEAYNKALEIDPNNQIAKSNRDRLLNYLASLPIIYNGGYLGLETTTTETQGYLKIVRTTKCTTWGYPFDLKLYRVVLSGQTIHVGTAETTLYYEGEWSVTVTQQPERTKIVVSPSSGHVSGKVKVVILGVWKESTLGLMIGLADMPPEKENLLWTKETSFYYSPEGKLLSKVTADLLLGHPYYDILLSFIDTSYDSSPYVTGGGKVPTIPTNMQEISKMDLNEFLSLSGFKWTKIRFTGITTLETWFRGASVFLNPPMSPNSENKYNGVVHFESNFIP